MRYRTLQLSLFLLSLQPSASYCPDTRNCKSIEFRRVINYFRSGIATRQEFYSLPKKHNFSVTKEHTISVLESAHRTFEMPRGVKKENLPSKICVVCNRPFTWRKKWERVWDEVSTCSKSCNRKRREEKNKSNHMENNTTPNGDLLDLSFSDRSQLVENELKVEMDFDADEMQESGYGLPGGRIATEKDENLFSFDKQMILLESLVNQNYCDSSGESSNDEETEGKGIHSEGDIMDPIERNKAERKAAKKLKKQARRLQREGRGDPSAGQKTCDMCGKSVDLLIRCTYDESLQWKMVCGKCWKVASGGVVDGDAMHPYYKYGGLWKNRRAQN